MITLKELIHATADTIKIDWLKVEETIGFPLHYDLKNFYSRILCAEQKTISGNFILNETDFIQKTGNELLDKCTVFLETVDGAVCCELGSTDINITVIFVYFVLF